MANPFLSISARTRSTPYTKRVEACGVKAYTVYNHTLLPTVFESPEADYHHLKAHVQVWDVSCERQIEINGPDAPRLVQMMTPRDFRRMKNDQCYYVPIVDNKGKLLNDPVAIKLDEARWWLSIADSDVLLYAKGLATGFNLDVEIFEPDVSPLAIQGPKAETLAARVFGEDVVKLRFFRHGKFVFNGTEFTVARSGWSKQGGFEVYLHDSSLGEPLWDALFNEGTDLNVRAGCPNLIERIEGGLLSYGNDFTDDHTPYEAGLSKYCAPDIFDECLGGAALRDHAENGPDRQIRAVVFDGDGVPACRSRWPVKALNGEPLGSVSSAAYSPDMNTNIGIAMVDKSHWEPGSSIKIETPDGVRNGEVRMLPLL